jgi:Transketolase, pyrimidine binding domain
MSFGISRIDLEMGASTREAFGAALAEAGADERIVVCDGDVNNSTFTNKFAEKYPDPFSFSQTRSIRSVCRSRSPTRM